MQFEWDIRYKEKVRGKVRTYKVLRAREEDYNDSYVDVPLKLRNRIRKLLTFDGRLYEAITSRFNNMAVFGHVTLVGDKLRLSGEFQYACHSRNIKPLDLIREVTDNEWERVKREVFA